MHFWKQSKTNKGVAKMNYIQRLAQADAYRLDSISKLRDLRETAVYLIELLENSKAPQMNILQDDALGKTISSYDIESLKTILQSILQESVKLVSKNELLIEASNNYLPEINNIINDLPVTQEEGDS